MVAIALQTLRIHPSPPIVRITCIFSSVGFIRKIIFKQNLTLESFYTFLPFAKKSAEMTPRSQILYGTE